MFANGLRYLRAGGRGFCLGAGKTRSQKNACLHRAAGTGENAAESPPSTACFVSPLLTWTYLIFSPELFCTRYLKPVGQTENSLFL
jgi:hypothetical protein